MEPSGLHRLSQAVTLWEEVNKIKRKERPKWEFGCQGGEKSYQKSPI